MTNFSERNGYKQNRSRLYQFEEMDERLKNAIWNFVRERYFAYEYDSVGSTPAEAAMKGVWKVVIGSSVDDLSSGYHALVEINTWYSNALWHEVYDMLEHLVSTSANKRRDAEKVNLILRREGSAYRFIGGVIAPITSEEEISEIEEVLLHTSSFDVASQHIRQAVWHLSNRGNLDARNAIKEAISAVESAVRVASGNPKANIDKGINKLGVHSQLEQAWKNMYHWTSDEGGVRHGKEEMSQVDLAKARYMVVVCSAFVNYLIARNSEEGSS